MTMLPACVYDRGYALCSRAVRYVLKHDRSDPLIRFVAIKSAQRRRTALANGVDQDNPHTFIFVEDGKSDLLTDAVFAMSQRVGGPGRLIRVFLLRAASHPELVLSMPGEQPVQTLRET